ncbi:MAG: carbohydrate ABC transporter permease [Spirochaetes bacterium]|nr:carbohydrate ABC transporter permease [Spirochaetota bacterium]MBU1081141.1 carbohydrate ABC transporter permease [Spirochaetota bacterium]
MPRIRSAGAAASGKRAGNALSYLVLGVWAVIVLVPLYLMIVNSFKPTSEIFLSPFSVSKAPIFDGFRMVFEEGNFLVYLFNSVFITVLSIVGVMILAALASYALVYWDVRLARAISVFFLLGLMIPMRIASINLIIMLKGLGLLDKLLGLLPIYLAMGMPMGIMILTEYFRTIPRELVQAAHIDGAGSFRIFWAVMLPLARPAMATVAIFNLVNIWNDLWFPLILIRSESQRTLMLGVTRLFGQFQTDWTSVLATLTLATVPILILYLVLSRQFIEGLTAGAVKE